MNGKTNHWKGSFGAVVKYSVAVALAVASLYAITKINVVLKPHEDVTGTVAVYGVVKPHKTEKELAKECLQDKTCRLLAEVGYYEARSESDEGVAAVMHVVLNRASYPKMWSSTPQGVVAQKHQFSFRWDGSMNKGFSEKKAYKRSLVIAKGVIDGTIDDITEGSNHYHTKYVFPKWRHSLKKKVVIGDHIFYDFKRG